MEADAPATAGGGDGDVAGAHRGDGVRRDAGLRRTDGVLERDWDILRS